MCIVLLTTAHPDYALIVIDNRDEFLLRPTSRPHWWTPSETGDACTQILSSRDLQRPEHGTWLGITRAGHFAVLTNFRDDPVDDNGTPAPPVAGQRSRGGMVTAWLTADAREPTEAFVERMLAGAGVAGVGGFSLICGTLRKTTLAGQAGRAGRAGRGLAIMSNRARSVDTVPWIAGTRGAVHGLSNARYGAPEADEWPKVRDGRRLLQELVAAPPSSESALRDALFGILDRDTLPSGDGLSFEEHIPLLKESIFVPAIGDDAHRLMTDAARARGPRASPATTDCPDLVIDDDTSANGYQTGLYGTQRQTVVLVDWHGRVAFTERALWDANGHPIPRGQGDAHYEFVIDGWDDEA